ncbi:MAG: hypothetical protein ABR509_03370 [Candidatus Limnocylindria bacterium]
MKRKRGAFPAVLSTLIALVISGLAVGVVGGADNHLMRWDIVSIDFAAGTIDEGGMASAVAADGSMITLTGSGTFRANPGTPQAVTGGGTWSTSGPAGTGGGTYWVTGFVDWHLAPGVAPPLTNLFADSADARAGLLVLRIAYSDGSDGVLVVSCHLVETPDSVFEGITASKGFVDYFNAVPPAPGVDANRTLFLVVK